MANAWITFLTKYYQDRKKKQPGYSYSDAMKDAKIEYNKTKGTSHTKSPKKGKKMRGGSLLEGAASIKESTEQLRGDLASEPAAPAATGDTDMSAQSGGKKSRRRKGTKGKKSKKCKSKRKSRSSRK